MPIYDYRCDACNTEKTDVYAKYEDVQICEKCGKEMVKNIGFGSFELKFNPQTDICDWKGNHNPYWDAVKAERAKGNKVKGYGER